MHVSTFLNNACGYLNQLRLCAPRGIFVWRLSNDSRVHYRPCTHREATTFGCIMYEAVSCHRPGYRELWIACRKSKQEQNVLQVASTRSVKPTIRLLPTALMTRCVSSLSIFEVGDLFCVYERLLSPAAICPPDLALQVHPGVMRKRRCCWTSLT